MPLQTRRVTCRGSARTRPHPDRIGGIAGAAAAWLEQQHANRPLLEGSSSLLTLLSRGVSLGNPGPTWAKASETSPSATRVPFFPVYHILVLRCSGPWDRAMSAIQARGSNAAWESEWECLAREVRAHCGEIEAASSSPALIASSPASEVGTQQT